MYLINTKNQVWYREILNCRNMGKLGNGKWTIEQGPRGPTFHGVDRYYVGISDGPGAMGNGQG